MRIAAISAALLGMTAIPTVANDAVQPIVLQGETLALIEAYGEAKVTPDKMVIDVGVVTTGENAAAALDANNRRMIQVLEALKDGGIEATSITTSEFDVDPQFRDNRQSDNLNDIIGYRVTNEVEVEFRDLENAGRIISTLFDAGANSVSSPRFGLDEERRASAAKAAEKAALANARSQVDNIAENLNMRVGRTLRLSNVEIDFDRGFRGHGGNYIVVTGSRIASTPIEAGQLTVTAELFVEYALVGR